MGDTGGHQEIVDKLYEIYQLKGFIREEEALDLMAAYNVSIKGVERITGVLLGRGAYFAEDAPFDDEDDIDLTQTDYEAVFSEVLAISPGQLELINFVRNVRAPQRREWRNLIPQAKSGNNYARDRLFEMYLRVVIKLALSTYKSDGYELDDLIQEGALGLLRAIYRYDSTNHGNFGSYLPWWVRQFMDRAIVSKSSIIRLPAYMAETLSSLSNEINKLEVENAYLPDVETLADKLGMEEDKLRRLLSHQQILLPIDEIMIENEDGYIECILPDRDMPEADDIIMKQTLKSAVNEMFNTIKKREASVLRFRYGIDGDQERTLEAVGRIFGVTRERIRQIESKAIKRLQHPTRQDKLKDFL
jgi:RNA polymerase primary sigma factor